MLRRRAACSFNASAAARCCAATAAAACVGDPAPRSAWPDRAAACVAAGARGGRCAAPCSSSRRGEFTAWGGSQPPSPASVVATVDARCGAAGDPAPTAAVPAPAPALAALAVMAWTRRLWGALLRARTSLSSSRVEAVWSITTLRSLKENVRAVVGGGVSTASPVIEHAQYDSTRHGWGIAWWLACWPTIMVAPTSSYQRLAFVRAQAHNSALFDSSTHGMEFRRLDGPSHQAAHATVSHATPARSALGSVHP